LAAAPRPEAIRDRAERAQTEAADPAVSAWVSANAGTGKTHVLTMRILRVLLAGTPPERILALTYTKAAAAEMSKRIFDRLAGWATSESSKLTSDLVKLLERPPLAEETALARQLFAKAIETPGGLKVQTIHAFCEQVLQRFPLEAGVPPQFVILDDAARSELLRHSIDEVLTETTLDKSSALAAALKTAVIYATDDDFDRIMSEALQFQDWLETAARLDGASEDRFAGAERLYRQLLGLQPDDHIDAVEAEIEALLPSARATRAREILAAGSANDQNAAKRLSQYLAAGSGHSRIAAIAELFLTEKGQLRRSLLTNSLAAQHPGVARELSQAQTAFVPVFERWRKLGLLTANLALLRLASAVMRRYTAAKARRDALDFDDLIRKTSQLLRQEVEGGCASASEWVLFKLDGGLDHILVDESQDTSPAQWHVIEALTKEFFAGAGARASLRTLFAVGDEKQSIYGFQGAAPEMFAQMGEKFAQHAQAARLAWRRIPLTVSFRTVEPVLSAVDQVFADPERTPGLTAGGTDTRHSAFRVGQAGLVEVWSTEKSVEVEASETWSPLDDSMASSPVTRLAARIADTIDGWLKSGEILCSAGRPVRAGDILILVRKRRPFAAAMVAALKARSIAVAGMDRLILTEQIAVQDLMVLGDFLMLPEDDLALATTLKSPLFGLDDEALLALANGRKGSLWTALLQQAETNPQFRAVADTLRQWRGRSDFVPPYEFYVSILDQKFRYESMRERMLARLGAEASDPIDEFLNLALTYDQQATPSLQGFLSYLRSNRREIKRDMEQGRNEVRVLTVHGAKGLEAPIVFLPDTCSVRSGRRPQGLLSLAGVKRPPGVGEPFLWPIKGSSRINAVGKAQVALERADRAERNRLLYVAMTRARDRLYIAGFEGKCPPPENCWYHLITHSLVGTKRQASDADAGLVWRQLAEQRAPPDLSPPEQVVAADNVQLPEWALRPAPREPRLAIPFAPSRLVPLETDEAGEPVARDLLDDPPPLAPAALAEHNRFLRGTLTHALLELLPELPAETWASSAKTFVCQRGAALSQHAQATIIAETLAILNHTDFAPLFGPDSRAEVPIVAEIERPEGRGPPLRLTGQIDRLALVDDHVMIVDYKTNRPPPAQPEDVAPTYLLQLSAYRLAVAHIFPAKRVRAAIVWTDGARIMEFPSELLDIYEQRLWLLDPSNLDV
jgi:ATP-dependent helicase/nuclease subunit A